uniref:Transmembrane phosphatase with tensin homology n=1 Tax=Oncorhynchus kisutch TaxID=8019 RepID=A0A8C7IPI1_ONCKI
MFFGVQFICMAKRDFAIHLITLHNILEYMQIAIIQTEAADFVKINICVILKATGRTICLCMTDSLCVSDCPVCFRFKVYFSSRLNIIDACIVVITLVVTMIYTFSDLTGASLIPRVVTFLRFLRIIILVRVFRLASQKKELEKVTRRMVSENKRRYQKDGFDLDLTYVTDRVIAMSFPSSGKQALYRNPIREVARFLDTKHEDHYRVYNLCSEKGYDPKFFHYRVERVFIDDHNVPSLEDMLKYTAGVREWMAADPKNIIAIHCKGGKGRTGTLVCTWLIDSDQFESAQDSLDYFGERRTDKSRSSKFQGVETPSQSRYVGYYEVMKTKFNRQLPPEQSLKIKSIRIHSIAGVGKGNGSDLKVKIIVRKKLVFLCVCAKQENCTVRHTHT